MITYPGFSRVESEKQLFICENCQHAWWYETGTAPSCCNEPSRAATPEETALALECLAESDVLRLPPENKPLRRAWLARWRGHCEVCGEPWKNHKCLNGVRVGEPR